MKYRMFTKKNVIVYKNRMECGEVLKNLKSEELKNHKTACADRYNYSGNKESNAKFFVFNIKTAYVRNKRGNSDST